MEEMINIAKILKNKPKGTRLYSPIFGECAFSLVREETDDICVKKHNGEKAFFDSKGLYNALGERLLFPSREMRDWSKFAWKKGDVLISDCGFVCIFKEWASDDYTKFNGCYLDGMPNAKTDKYSKLDNNTAYGYIREIERKLGGKLNLETLKIEKQLEFKNGDVLFVKCDKQDFIEIFNYSKKNGDLYDHASLDTATQDLDISGKYRICKDEIVEIRLATDEEKQQLFSALAKVGKAFDAEKKQIVDLKPKVELKPFDKVLVRDNSKQKWIPDMYRFYDKDEEFPYNCFSSTYKRCIPYNEDTKHLLGTTDEWKGGEG